MSTNQQSATLLRLNKQDQVKAFNEIGFTDMTEESRASDFARRIRWATGLLDVNLACNKISDNSRYFFTREEWDSLTTANKLLFIKRGVRVRAHCQSFVIAAQDCVAANFTTLFCWGGYGKNIEGITQKGLGKMYSYFNGEEDTQTTIEALRGSINNGVTGAPAAEAAASYKAFTLEEDGLEDTTKWFLASTGHLILTYRYRDPIDEMMRYMWGGDSVLKDKYYCASTIWDNSTAWAVELSTGRVNTISKATVDYRVRAFSNE